MDTAVEDGRISLPRVSGGVSNDIPPSAPDNQSSPRKRGCFHDPQQRLEADPVFPA